jgi:hypothetical protein
MTRQLPPATCIGHAIRSVRNNINYAFRISWPWYAILVPLGLGASYLIDTLTGGDPQKILTAPVMAIYFVLMAVSMVAFASIAVNWHRYILLDEVPQGGQIFRFDDKTWRYLGNVLLIFLILFLISALIWAALFIVIASAAGGFLTFTAFVLFIVALLFVAVLFFRLSVKLPAIALGRRDFRLADSLAATKDNNLRLLLLVLLEIAIVLVAVVAMLILIVVASYVSVMLGFVLGAILQALFNWVFTIFGITLLTSLYGFFVENRDF